MPAPYGNERVGLRAAQDDGTMPRCDPNQLFVRPPKLRVLVTAPLDLRPVADLRPTVVGKDRAATEKLSHPVAPGIGARPIAVGRELELLPGATRGPDGHDRHFKVVAPALFDPGDAATADRELGDAIPGAAENSGLHAHRSAAGSAPDDDSPRTGALDARRHRGAIAVGREEGDSPRD